MWILASFFCKIWMVLGASKLLCRLVVYYKMVSEDFRG